MADERTLAEAWRAIDDLRAAQRDLLRRDVYEADKRTLAAERDDARRRFTQLENNDTTQTASGRAWVLGIGLAVIGAALGWLAQIMQARGGH